jgi:hypothetical protein
MRSKDREIANKTFSSLLEEEFLQDLRFATRFTSIQEEERNLKQQRVLTLLRDKYVPGGECPSDLFSCVSEELQKEYNIIHNKICGIIYEPPSRHLPQQS